MYEVRPKFAKWSELYDNEISEAKHGRGNERFYDLDWLTRQYRIGLSDQYR
jgi:hypothetical protein